MSWNLLTIIPGWGHYGILSSTDLKGLCLLMLSAVDGIGAIVAAKLIEKDSEVSSGFSEQG